MNDQITNTVSGAAGYECTRTERSEYAKRAALRDFARELERDENINHEESTE
jgi:ribosomal protein S11